MYIVDTNIWLERLLDQKQSEPLGVGVYVGQHLSFTCDGQTSEGFRCQGQNRTWENRPSGVEEGACGNFGYGSQAEAHRGTCGKPLDPKVARTLILSRPPVSSGNKGAQQEEMITWRRI
jgi:hypothetical protein